MQLFCEYFVIFLVVSSVLPNTSATASVLLNTSVPAFAAASATANSTDANDIFDRNRTATPPRELRTAPHGTAPQRQCSDRQRELSARELDGTGGPVNNRAASPRGDVAGLRPAGNQTTKPHTRGAGRSAGCGAVCVSRRPSNRTVRGAVAVLCGTDPPVTSTKLRTTATRLSEHYRPATATILPNRLALGNTRSSLARRFWPDKPASARADISRSVRRISNESNLIQSNLIQSNLIQSNLI